MAGSRPQFIAVIGDGLCSSDVAALAEEIGHELAKRGAVIVCGGLGGVMAAVCKGAVEAGGLTVGILPGTSRSEANPHVVVPIPTGLGQARNVLVVQAAQAVIAVHGEYGTLSEIGHALKLGIPVIGLNTWHLVREGVERDDIIRAETPVQAVEKALELALRRRARQGGE